MPASSRRASSSLVRLAGVAIGLAVVGAGVPDQAEAQPYVPYVVDDPIGPIRCFAIATEEELSEQSAIELCTGATTSAPGECYAATLAQVPDLSSQQIVQLCYRATSLAPLGCYQRLDASGVVTNQQAIEYCATTCPLGPAPPQTSDPRCFALGNERDDLALQTIGELCYASRSAGPVQCYATGEEITSLATTQLVQLCTQRYSCQYINAPVATY